ncbi:endonuclease III [Candidatus Peregrinibacteria bacterium]|nr:endonuclease III [Candidatus Peregrinibacteria bacterium]
MENRVRKIIQTLNKLYPDPKPFLNFRTPFELLVAAILSAQCTDARVNLVTPALFRAAKTPQALLKLGERKLMAYVKSTGFYRAKTKSIMDASRMLIEKFSGKVPAELEQLQTLPGVGRKTASVVLAQAFHIPAFPVDRHVLRVANRLGLAHAKTPDNTADQIETTIPKNLWITLHMQLVAHGRKICRPHPKCGACSLLPYCPEGKRRML